MGIGTILIMGVIFAVIAAAYADHKGSMPPKRAAAWGFCLGVVGHLVVVLSKPKAAPATEGETAP